MAAGEIVAGPHVRNACKRHIADLKRKDGIWFDQDAANHAFAFFEDFRAQDVGRHQVGRELDALGFHAEHDAQRVDQLGLGEARNADQQKMAA